MSNFIQVVGGCADASRVGHVLNGSLGLSSYEMKEESRVDLVFSAAFTNVTRARGDHFGAL